MRSCRTRKRAIISVAPIYCDNFDVLSVDPSLGQIYTHPARAASRVYVRPLVVAADCGVRQFSWLKVNYHELIRTELENQTRCGSGEHCQQWVCEAWRRSVVKWESLSTNNNTKKNNNFKNNVRTWPLGSRFHSQKKQISFAHPHEIAVPRCTHHHHHWTRKRAMSVLLLFWLAECHATKKNCKVQR